MTGRVLIDEELSELEEIADGVLFWGDDVVPNLIATIRDRDKAISALRTINDGNQESLRGWYEDFQQVSKQNTILREALEQICRCDALKVIVWAEVNERDISERDYLIHIAREALTKVETP